MEYIAIAAGMSALSACISEGVNWYWIYRHEEYKKLIKDIAENQIKFDAMKEKQLFNAGTQGLSQQKVQERKIKAFEDGLKAQQSMLMQMKSKGVLFVGLISLVFIRVVYSQFEGIAVARLPFEPPQWVSRITHYGLSEDESSRACSVIFIYILMNLTIAAYVKRLLGLEGPRVAQSTPMPWG